MAGKVNPATENNVGHPSSTEAQGRNTQKARPCPSRIKEFRLQFEATQEEVRLQPPPVVVVVETTSLCFRWFIRLTYLSSQTVAKSRLR